MLFVPQPQNGGVLSNLPPPFVLENIMLVTKEERLIAFRAKCDRRNAITKRMKEIEHNETIMNVVDSRMLNMNNFQEKRRVEEEEYLTLLQELDVLLGR